MPNSRTINCLVATGCAGLMAVALYMEHAWGLEPCPMCILQRVMVVATGLVALLAAIHGPGAPGIRRYGWLTLACAAGGAYISGRHVWIQNLPPDQVPACGPSLGYMLEVFPVSEVLYMLLLGDGNCAEVLWSFLGISIPGWTLVAFIMLMALAVFQIMRARQHGSR